MNINKFDNQIRSVKQRIRNLKAGISEGVCYSVFFTKNNVKDRILNRITVNSIGLIRRNVVIEEPEIIRIEIYETDISKKILWVQTIDLRDDIDQLKTQSSEKESFSGLGAAEVQQLVQSQLAEIRKQETFEKLQKEVEISNSENLKLRQQLQATEEKYQQQLQEVEEELQQVLDESNEKIEELEKVIHTKSGIKYYAGIIGDLLEGLGIPKDKIGKPIAALMGFNDKESEQKKPSEKEDTSGIVEENEEQNEEQKEHQPTTKKVDNQTKRQEIVDLISAYLHSVSNETLSDIFTLFSVIESKPTIIKELIEKAKTLK